MTKKNIPEKHIKKSNENAQEQEEKRLPNLQETNSNHQWNSENKKKLILKILSQNEYNHKYFFKILNLFK